MGRNKNRGLIKDIKEGNEEVLLYLFRKYYPDMKRIFQSHRIDEKEIPRQSALVIVKIWMEIHRNDFSENIDLTSYLLNTTKENADKLAAERKAAKKNKLKEDGAGNKSPQEIVAECVNVLEDASRKVLQWRYAESYSVEQVAESLNANAAAADDFLDKSFEKLSSIVKIRMEYPVS